MEEQLGRATRRKRELFLDLFARHGTSRSRASVAGLLSVGRRSPAARPSLDVGVRAPRSRGRGRRARVVLRAGGRGLRADGDGADARGMPARGRGPRARPVRRRCTRERRRTPSSPRGSRRVVRPRDWGSSTPAPWKRPIGLLDRGEVRVAEPDGRRLARATSGRRRRCCSTSGSAAWRRSRSGPFEYHDKLPLKHGYDDAGVRVVPPATASLRRATSRPGWC